MSKPVFIISAPFDTFSGYGARSRDLIKSIIELHKYDVKLLPQRWGDTPINFCQEQKDWKFLFSHVVQSVNTQPDIWMQITIPSEFRPIGKYNIGCTAGIESTGCDPSWIEGLNRMDLNLVSSNHSKKIFSEVKFEQKSKQTNEVVGVLKLEKPIEVVFEGVDTEVYKHLESKDIL